MKTTLSRILEHGPCGQDPEDGCGWWRLLNHLGKTEPDNKPLSMITILESNGLDDALWALRSVEGYEREVRLFGCWCACQSLPIFERDYPNDMRPRQAIETAALYAEGIVDNAAWAAAWDAARAAAWAAARDAAGDAAWAAAWAAAGDAAGDAQKGEFIQLCKLGHDYMPAL